MHFVSFKKGNIVAETLIMFPVNVSRFAHHGKHVLIVAETKFASQEEKINVSYGKFRRFEVN